MRPSAGGLLKTEKASSTILRADGQTRPLIETRRLIKSVKSKLTPDESFGQTLDHLQSDKLYKRNMMTVVFAGREKAGPSIGLLAFLVNLSKMRSKMVG